jgi:hypothetical protein
VEKCTYKVGEILTVLQIVPMRWVEYPCSCKSCGRVGECTYEVGGVPLLLQELWQGGRVYL